MGILITTPIFDDNDCELPSITVTRDAADVLDTEDFLYSLDDTEVHHNFPVTTAEDFSIFPDSLFQAARSGDPTQKQNVEDFIRARLDQVAQSRGSGDDGCSRCSPLVRCLEDSLECPVCRDRVVGEVYQCHAGHVMCSHCRSRLLTCPVCRSLLTLPAIRNRALEKLACIIG